LEVLWLAAAEIDPLSDTERQRFGLARLQSGRVWPAAASDCDRMAAAYYDPGRRSPGRGLAAIAAEGAIRSCSADAIAGTPRSVYQLGRARLAAGDRTGGLRALSDALAQHYPAAGVDLADQLLADSPNAETKASAVGLYQQAFEAGLSVGAVRLGQFYEARASDSVGGLEASKDASLAWSWYQRAKSRGDPSALARFAEREEQDAVRAETSAARDRLWLDAFSDYAAAVTLARQQEWSEELWRNWRYRRASLARLLEQDGLMREVAQRYQSSIDGGVVGQ
jgi:hypothetical protein